MSNCTLFIEFSSYFSIKSYLAGSKIPIIITNTNEIMINNFINNYPQCYFQYNYLSPLTKVCFNKIR